MTRRYGLTIIIAVGLTAIFTTSIATAQMPRTISYQGVLADAGGSLLPDGNYSLRLALYESVSGGAPIWSETQTATVVRGVFNALIGSGAALPNSLSFDRAYYLGVTVDGGAELVPRTPLTAVPYALYAERAAGLTPGATGVVTSLNGAEGAVTLQGGGGTTINRSGNTVTISSTGGGGTGIQGVQNLDGALTITTPNGPVATIDITDGGIINEMLANNAVTTDRIANNTITPIKLNKAGATAGQVLGYNGASVLWTNDGVTLPFAARRDSSGGMALLDIQNGNPSSGSIALLGVLGTRPSSWATTPAGVAGINGTGGNGVFGYSQGGGAGVAGEAYGAADALFGISYGSGNGVRANASGSGNAVSGLIFGSGSGNAGHFQINNTASTVEALHATTNSANKGAGLFEITNASNGVAALTGKTNNNLGFGYGVHGIVTATGTTGSNSAAGVVGEHMGTNGIGMGVWGNHRGGGVGVFGSSETGIGVLAQTWNTTAPATALEIRNGAIKVSGTFQPAFVHTATVANQSSSNGTGLDHPLCNGDANAFLLVTQLLVNGGPYNDSPIGVYYNTGTSRWEIFNQDGTAVPTNAKFNVLVIKK